jgi:hypothetical protein
MEFSNKALAVLLLAAVVVSLGGTIISLNRLSQVQTVGYATTSTGTVNLTIGSSTSITTVDGNSVNFGSCTPATGTNATIDTENLSNTSVVCQFYMQGNYSNISVRNDGNVNATVTIKASQVGRLDNTTGVAAFLNSTSATSSLRYKIQNNGRGSYTGGCVAGTNYAAAYTAFTQASYYTAACGKLTVGSTANSIVTQFQVNVPYDAPQGLSTVTVTYSASANNS